MNLYFCRSRPKLLNEPPLVRMKCLYCAPISGCPSPSTDICGVTGMSRQVVRLPVTTTSKLNEFRRQVRRIKVAEGVFAGLFGLLISWAVVFGSDRFVDTAALIRAAILIAGTLGFGLFFPLRMHRWVWGTRSMQQVARLLSQRYPAMGDQLLGVVELANGEQDLGESYALATAAVDQVDFAVRSRDFTDAVPKPRSRHWAIASAVPVLLLMTASAVVPDAAWNAVGRWLTPWRAIDRYTFAQIEELPHGMVVPHGEGYQLTARLRNETKWAPESGRILLDGQPAVAVDQDAGEYDFSLPPLTSDGVLNVRIGDVRERVGVRPVTRPELTAITASVTLPAYLEYTKQLTQDVRGGAISVVKGAQVSFDAEVSRNLTDAVLSAGVAEVDGRTILTSGQNVSESETLEFEWTDEFGLSSRQPFPLNIRAVDDAPPQVSCIQNDSMHVILSTDVITFSVSAGDDFGLRSMGLEWNGIAHPLYNPEPDTADKIVQAGSPEEPSLSTQATFCAESDNVRPQSLKIRAWAEDYKPDRGRAYSPAVVLHVLSPEDHAVWMSEQLRRWASRADDVYEQEMRLHDANREFRRMDMSELRTQKNQRRILQQASSERANAHRLSQVADQGDQLIDQAMRNPEMMVGHLETFAQALKQIRDIAENRMPSVADLLTAATQPKRSRTAIPGSSLSRKSRSSPMAGNDRSTPKGSPGSGNSTKEKDGPVVPSLVDRESGFNPEQPPGKEQQKSRTTPRGSPKFGLPATTLEGGPKDDSKPQKQKPGSTIEQAVEEQADLLAEFGKVREELQKIMDDLDNSTFVKRLKAASRRQLEMAADLNRTLYKGFGVRSADLEDHEREQAERIAVREEEESQSVWLIRSDLEAYYSRRKEEKFRRIADEMAELQIVSKLGLLGTRVRSNQSGDSISRVEFWADTLDRWAEELVSASKCGACRGSKGNSLPPSIVLEIMRILEGEIDLRDETRAAETARKAVEREDYETSVARLYETQSVLHERTLAVMDDIRAIPNGDRKFGKELQITGMAAAAMLDAAKLLSQSTTEAAVIAAETESIELLLQSKRCNPNGGGGGGASPGGGGGGDTETVALALHGPGSDPNAHIESRDIQQDTGTTGDRLPAEFRDGLEAFFNAVEIGN